MVLICLNRSMEVIDRNRLKLNVQDDFDPKKTPGIES